MFVRAPVSAACTEEPTGSDRFLISSPAGMGMAVG